jgi:hypothetical protein
MTARCGGGVRRFDKKGRKTGLDGGLVFSLVELTLTHDQGQGTKGRKLLVN